MFSDQSAELSLNTPSRCITSITADRTHHRFLVGTFSPSSSSSTPPSSNNNNNNSLYLLRFHEELNELGIDGILSHPTGQVWNVSSCPYDKGLVITCGERRRSGGYHHQTKLWRIPKSVIENEDELEYIPEEDDVEENIHSASASGRVGGDSLLRQSETSVDGMVDRSGGRGRKSRVVMEEVATLGGGGADKRRNDGTSSSLGGNHGMFEGRLSSILWNPSCASSSSGGMGGGYFDSTSGYGEDDDNDENYNDDDDDIGGYGDESETSAATGDVLTLDYTGQIHRYDLKQISSSSSSASVVQSFSLPTTSSSSSSPLAAPPKMAWDPHDTSSIACSINTTVKLYDLRTSAVSSSSSLPQYAHRYGITDLDYNPNKTYTLVTSGCDGLVKFWDLRFLPSSSSSSKKKKMKPIKMIRGGHTHYTTTVKYNTFHDQLMVSGGSDSVVNLWRISSVSSAPLLDLGDDDDDNDEDNMDDGDDNVFQGENQEDDDDYAPQMTSNPSEEEEDDDNDLMGNTPSKNRTTTKESNNNKNKDDSAPDVRVSSHIHTDAVYDVTWSAVDAWVFVSLSYDGNVILNHVPSKEKYKILL